MSGKFAVGQWVWNDVLKSCARVESIDDEGNLHVTYHTFGMGDYGTTLADGQVYVFGTTHARPIGDAPFYVTDLLAAWNEAITENNARAWVPVEPSGPAHLVLCRGSVVLYRGTSYVAAERAYDTARQHSRDGVMPEAGVIIMSHTPYRVVAWIEGVEYAVKPIPVTYR